MESNQIISDLESLIAEKIFIKIERWNLFLGDAGLSRKLAIECLSNINMGISEAVKTSIKNIRVKVGDGNESIPLSTLVTSPQLKDLEELLEQITL